ncbi:MAG: Fe-S cluster assembly protein HesB [Clostridioides sp.]|jgi:Fe-S cluster assembly iron-binding protein IscA|nr:Fe-S cluster assembly protein HesB [Clostridioides sp.]
MKITVPENAVETLKNIIKTSTDKPDTIRVFYQGTSCSGPAFGLALDKKTDLDEECEFEGLKFIMSVDEYKMFGDMAIEDMGYGFRVIPENMVGQASGCSGCAGCGGGEQ